MNVQLCNAWLENDETAAMMEPRPTILRIAKKDYISLLAIYINLAGKSFCPEFVESVKTINLLRRLFTIKPPRIAMSATFRQSVYAQLPPWLYPSLSQHCLRPETRSNHLPFQLSHDFQRSNAAARWYCRIANGQ